MNESLKQALKIALGVVLLCAEGVAIYLINNPDSLNMFFAITTFIAGSAPLLTLVWVVKRCKELTKREYELFFRVLSVVAPGLAIILFDILPQKWIEYINVGLMILIFPFIIWLIFFS